MNLFPLNIPLNPDMVPMPQFTRVLMAAGIVTIEAQVWAWQRGFFNLV